MWWRIELDKSGAILSCAHVEMSGTSRGRIRFVEADSDAEACSRSVDGYRRSLLYHREKGATLRAAQTARGLCCISYCKNEPEHGKKRCKEHAAIGNANSRRWRSGEARANHPSEDLAAEARAADRRRVTRKARDEKGGEAGLRVVLLSKFDTLGPVAFRAWLVAGIEKFNAARAAQKKEPTK